MTNDPLEAFKLAVRRARERYMPAPADVVREAFRELDYITLSTQETRTQFNTILRHVFVRTLDVLERYEEPAYQKAGFNALFEVRNADIDKALEVLNSGKNQRESFIEASRWLMSGWYPYLRAMFLSVAQSRKARGGRDFELQLETLFGLMELPFEKQLKKGGSAGGQRTDFVFPSSEFLQRERPRAVVVSAKRTLRERWEQVVDELHRLNCPNVYIATADEDISDDKVEQIANRNIYLVVWDELKQSRFVKNSTVRSYTHLANDVLGYHLDRFWRAEKPDR